MTLKRLKCFSMFHLQNVVRNLINCDYVSQSENASVPVTWKKGNLHQFPAKSNCRLPSILSPILIHMGPLVLIPLWCQTTTIKLFASFHFPPECHKLDIKLKWTFNRWRHQDELCSPYTPSLSWRNAVHHDYTSESARGAVYPLTRSTSYNTNIGLMTAQEIHVYKRGLSVLL